MVKYSWPLIHMANNFYPQMRIHVHVELISYSWQSAHTCFCTHGQVLIPWTSTHTANLSIQIVPWINKTDSFVQNKQNIFYSWKSALCGNRQNKMYSNYKHLIPHQIRSANHFTKGTYCIAIKLPYRQLQRWNNSIIHESNVGWQVQNRNRNEKLQKSN